MMRRVPPSIYDSAYYVTVGEGTNLTRIAPALSPRLAYMLHLADIRKGMHVLDVGCGTGELCFALAKRGATAFGIDYSKDAIRACRTKRRTAPARIRGRVTFALGDATALRKHVPPQAFDAVFITDVVEHLYPEQLHRLFRGLKGYLAPGAQVYIHTAPNLEFYRYGYPLIRWCWPLLRHIPPVRAIVDTKENWRGRKRLPKDPEEGSHNKLGHVNEQTPRALRESLVRCGYAAEVRVVPFLRPVTGAKIRVLYALLSLPGLRKLFGADIIAVAKSI